MITRHPLKKNPTLPDLQEYVRLVLRDRGFDEETVAEKFMLLLEECGELAKAARKTQQIKIDVTSEQYAVADELADVLIYLLDISNKFHIDLEKAFRDKEEKNGQRSWS